jgi:hypothetical protein
MVVAQQRAWPYCRCQACQLATCCGIYGPLGNHDGQIARLVKAATFRSTNNLCCPVLTSHEARQTPARPPESMGANRTILDSVALEAGGGSLSHTIAGRSGSFRRSTARGCCTASVPLDRRGRWGWSSASASCSPSRQHDSSGHGPHPAKRKEAGGG